MKINLKLKSHSKIILSIIGVLALYMLLVHLLVYFERDSDQSALTTYSNAFWYTLVTLSTVGYGDIFPATTYGRVIAMVFIFASIGIFGILIGKLSSLMATIKENKLFGYNGTDFQNHALIIGWDDFSASVVDQLMGVGRRVAIVSHEKEHIELIHEKYASSKNIFVLYADYSNHELLKKVNVEEANVAFINLGSDTDNLVYVIDFKKDYPTLDLVVSLQNANLKGTFMAAGVSNTITNQNISAKLLASYMFEPDVANYSESLLSFAKEAGDYDIKQLYVNNQNPYKGEGYNKIFLDLKRKYNVVLIGVSKNLGNGQRKLLKNPSKSIIINEGDYLILIIDKLSYEKLKTEFGVEEEGYNFKSKNNE